jgi:hypothetical protein
LHLTERVTAFIDVYICVWGNAQFNLCLFLTMYWISLDRSPNVCRLSTIYYGFPHRFIVYFFLQLVKKCRTHNDESRSKNTPYIKMYYDEWNLNGYVLSIKKKKIYIVVDILSSLLNNYHVHLNINLVRLHLLSICAMLINIDSLFIYVYFAD